MTEDVSGLIKELRSHVVDCYGGKNDTMRRAADALTSLSLQLAAVEGERKRFNGARPLPYDRETLGRFVREAWVRWATAQPAPKPSWLVPYDELSEPDKEADRQIGEALARWTLIGDAAQASLAEITTLRKELAEARAENERLQSVLEKLTRDAGKVHRLGAVPGNQWPPLACSLIEARASMSDILARQAARPVLRPPSKAKGENK